MNQFSSQQMVLSTQEIQSCRHKSEKRWYRGLVIINLIIIFAVTAAFFVSLDDNIKKFNTVIDKFIEEALNPDKEESKSIDVEELEKKVPTEVEMFFMIVGTMLLFPIAVNILYAQYRSRAIKITERNFPEVYERINLYANKLGMKKVPEAYIVQENGVLNAFSAFIIRKQYVQINADLFEIAYREYGDIESLSFIIAHELSHIKLKHATFAYNFWILISKGIPILGSTASRAREYSCDRLAQRITENNGLEAMNVLMVGKHLYKNVDIEDYVNHSYEIKGFFVWANNLLSSHPIMPKRIRALAMGQGSGELY